MDEEAVEEGIEKIHTEYVSNIQYNNENSLSSVLAIAYLSSMEYYFKPVRELPTGRGFADFVFIPKPEYVSSYPALVVELKWNKNAETALQQIKEKQYPDSVPYCLSPLNRKWFPFYQYFYNFSYFSIRH